MVFVIQNTQNRDTKALQLKLDELIRVNQVARNSLISLEEKSELEVEEIRRACLDGRVERREGAGALVRRSHLTSESHGVEQEIPRLRRYARALTRSGDRADDLVQDTLVRAMAKAHLWQAGTDIRAWLFTIMHNQHVNAVRRAIREQRTVDIEGLSSSLVATTDPTASRQLRELECALARLRGEQREVVLLVGLEGMSYETAAKVLAVPIGTVRSRLSRAREALRQFMDMNGEAKSASGARQRRPALAGDVAA